MRSAANILADNLREWRRTRKLNQAELSEHAGLSRNMVQQVETLSLWPSPKTIHALAQALEIDDGLLFSEAFDKKPPSLEECFEMVAEFMASPLRRKLVCASADLKENEIVHLLALIDELRGIRSDARQSRGEAKKPGKQNT